MFPNVLFDYGGCFVALKVDRFFTANRLEVVLNGVPASIEVWVTEPGSNDTIHVQADAPFFAGWGVKVACTTDDEVLRVVVTSGRQRDEEQSASPEALGAFSETKESAMLRQDAAPKVSLTFFAGPNGLTYRIIE